MKVQLNRYPGSLAAEMPAGENARVATYRTADPAAAFAAATSEVMWGRESSGAT